MKRMHVAKLVNYNVNWIWHMILSHLPAPSAGCKYLCEHRWGTLQDQHVFVAKAFKWPAAGCDLAFQICTMTLTIHHIHKPFAHALGNQRTEIWRNYTSIKKRLSQLPKWHRGHHHSICEWQVKNKVIWINKNGYRWDERHSQIHTAITWSHLTCPYNGLNFPLPFCWAIWIHCILIYEQFISVGLLIKCFSTFRINWLHPDGIRKVYLNCL